MNDIEKLKAYHNIESFLDDDMKDTLQEKLGLKNANLNNRLPGLRYEDEFALMLQFSNQFKHIISIDETTSLLTNNSYQSDFLVHLKNDTKMMIEVKSTKDRKFKISKNNFEKKKQFSDDLNYELFFAIKLSGFWVFYHSNYLIENNYKINFDENMSSSIFCHLLDLDVYEIPVGTRIERLYTHCNNHTLPITHIEHGNLLSVKLYFNDILIFEVNHENKEYLPFTILFELWFEMTIDKLIETNINDIKNLLVNDFLDNLLTVDYRYYLSLINHITHDNNFRYNSSSFLKYLASDSEYLFNKDILKEMFISLKKLGLPIKFGKYENSTLLKFYD